MSAKKDLRRGLVVGDIIEIVYAGKKEPIEEIQITYLPEAYDTELRKGGETIMAKEYVDAKIKFVSGVHASDRYNEDNYDIMHDTKNGIISFTHKNLGNFSLPVNMEGIGAVAKATGTSNSAAATATAPSANSSDSEYDSSGGARRRRRRSKKAKKAKRSTKSKKGKAKRSNKSRYTRRR